MDKYSVPKITLYILNDKEYSYNLKVPINPVLRALSSVSSFLLPFVLLDLDFKSNPPIHMEDAMFSVLNDPPVLPLILSSVPSSSRSPS